MSCESTNRSSTQVSADLYYSWLKFGSFYGQPDSTLTNYMAIRDSLGYERMMNEDSTGTTYLKMLDQRGLLSSPFVYLRKDNGHTFLLFMDEQDYDNFNNFDYRELIDKNEKVRVKAEIDSLWEKMYWCTNLISVKVIKGQTLQRQKKFTIENYR